MELPHYGQILTTKNTILSFINDIEIPVVENTIYLLTYGFSTRDEYVKLYAVCSRLYYLSKLVYRGKDGICKLDLERYQKEIFEGFAETVGEVTEIMTRQRSEGTEPVTQQEASKVFKKLKILELLWCRGISCLCEQIYIPEIAYEMEYVIKNGDKLSMPEYKSEYSMFPDNYKDFNYTEAIAEYFEETDGWF